MTKKRLYIFDFDGTVADTLPLCFACYRIAFHVYLHRDMSDDAIQRYFGPSEAVVIENIMRDGASAGSPTQQAESDVSNAVELFYWLNRALHEEFVDPSSVEPVKKMLAEARQRGCQLALVTGKGRRSLEISMDELGLEGFFDYVVTDDDIPRPKPYPDGINAVLSALGCCAEDAAYIGDADLDIEAARAAGVEPIAATWFGERCSADRESVAFATTPMNVLVLGGTL